MTKQSIIDGTIEVINRLPDNKAEEISDFADFVIRRYEEQKITEGLQQMISQSKSFEFLYHEEELYTEADIKEK